jgi:hypothetical protein
MWNLCHNNNKIRLRRVWSHVTLSFKCKLSASSHSWFNMDNFGTDSHLLCFSISEYNHSFKVNFLSASIVKFFKSTFYSNRQSLEFLCEGSHHSCTSSFNSSNLITILIKSNSEWVSCSKEPFENL